MNHHDYKIIVLSSKDDYSEEYIKESIDSVIDTLEPNPDLELVIDMSKYNKTTKFNDTIMRLYDKKYSIHVLSSLSLSYLFNFNKDKFTDYATPLALVKSTVNKKVIFIGFGLNDRSFIVSAAEALRLESYYYDYTKLK